jgi:ribosomal protein L3 glutamine methyltransferase
MSPNQQSDNAREGRGRDNVEAAFPQLPLLWLDTEHSEGEVFWIGAADLG